MTDIEDIGLNYKQQSFKPDSAKDVDLKRNNLLVWYRANRRLLPWRGDNTTIERSPYGTWVSEIMLQQTRVDTVINYWNKWMERFPTVQVLAVATPDEVNQLWAGLGYYRRAQQLLKGAQFVMKEFDGVVPSLVVDLLRIPGVGPYTAGAISSIAFDRVEPLVDGNVIRVLSRMYAINLEVGAPGGAMEKRCWSLAGQLVDPAAPGDFNQSLMELGATVCKPTSPLCDSCPVRSTCKALHLVAYGAAQSADTTLPSSVSFFPRKVPKKRPREVAVSVCVFVSLSVDTDSTEKVARYLFNRRPGSGLLANQWEFPAVELLEMESLVDAENEDLSPSEAPSEQALWEPLPAYLRDTLGVQFVPRIGEFVEEKAQLFLRSTLFECDASAFPASLSIDPILHVFSHQRHTMHITVKHVGHIEEGSGVALDRAPLRWMTAAEIVSEGITTGCKKVLQAVEALRMPSSVKKSRRPSVVRSTKAREKATLSEDVVINLTDEKQIIKKNAFDVLLQASSSAVATDKTKNSAKGTLQLVSKKRKQS
jgi:A/G-specific adenine glycosylase